MKPICHPQGRYIAVAASLTGGNALATLVRMIQLWCMELGCNVPQVKWIMTSYLIVQFKFKP